MDDIEKGVIKKAAGRGGQDQGCYGSEKGKLYVIVIWWCHHLACWALLKVLRMNLKT